MSIEAIRWALDVECPSPGAKLLLLLLANYANENDECYPGQERLAGQACMSTRAVRENVQKLENFGLIVRNVRQRQDGRGRTSDLFRLLTNRQNQPVDQMTNRKIPHDQPAESSGEPLEEPSESAGLDSGRKDSLLPETESTLPREDGGDLCHAMQRVWNDTVAGTDIPRCRDLSPKRRRAMVSRFRDAFERSMPQWELYCRRIAASDFLAGRLQTDRSWRASIEWALNRENIAKVRDGKYDNPRRRVAV